MSNNFICPFCKKVLEKKKDFIYACDSSGLVLDLENRRVHITDDAPEHLKQSYLFLNYFKLTEPFMVFSPEHLYSENFRLNDCLFLGCKRVNKYVKCIDAKRLRLSDLKDKHLIAAQGNLADGLIKNLTNAIELSSSDNPLIRTEIPDSKRLLYLKVLLELSNYIPASNKVRDVVNMYLQPTLEGVIQNMYEPFEGVCIDDITDEMALHSLLVFDPATNIKWGKGPDELKENIVNFVKACLNDLDKVDIKTKKEPAVPCGWQNKRLENLRYTFYKHMASTAVNTEERNDLPSFDILNHEFNTDYFSGYNTGNRINTEFSPVFNVYKVLELLWDKYCKQQMNYGISGKRKFLTSIGKDIPTSNEELVLLFWSEMCNYINTKS